MAKENVNVRLEPGMLTQMDMSADRVGMNRSDFVFESCNLFLSMDKEWTCKKVQGYAKNLNTIEAVVLQNMFIKYLAQVEAKKQVYGSYSGIMEEFMTVHDDKGPRMLTGEELYNVLLDKYTRDEKHNKDKRDKKIEDYKNL